MRVKWVNLYSSFQEEKPLIWNIPDAPLRKSRKLNHPSKKYSVFDLSPEIDKY